jgi:hypothetical protein
MPATTLEEARALLFAALDVAVVNNVVGAGGQPAVTKVFDHEPHPKETAQPGWVTIFATGVTPDDWLFAIRIYQTIDVDQHEAQTNIGVVIDAIDAALASATNVGPSQWTIGFTDNLDAVVAQSDVEIGREDY